MLIILIIAAEKVLTQVKNLLANELTAMKSEIRAFHEQIVNYTLKQLVDQLKPSAIATLFTASVPSSSSLLLDVEPWQNGSGECCPILVTFSHLGIGGVNMKNEAHRLYRPDINPNTTAVSGDMALPPIRYREVSCNPIALNKPCRFQTQMGLKMLTGYRCEQQFSYVFALIEVDDFFRGSRMQIGNATLGYDYIKVRSGCACTRVGDRN